VLFTSHDHEFVNTLVNRVIELTPAGIIDRLMRFDEYVASAEVAKTRELMVKKAA
jgi:ATPase subunit of ABC transporter with duplicated ATPase domains